MDMTHEIASRFTDTAIPRTITLDVLSIWYRNLTARRVLACMEIERLSDTGLTEEQRKAEIAKPFWR